ncbi:MAG TPA: AAA family ATPase [Chthoniobacteraceae bacterium]|nr:AAA family ATPase [Chthoniobacteraceae bacterium]
MVNETVPSTSPAPVSSSDVAAIDQLGAVSRRMREQLARVIIGQEQVVERLLISIFGRGHALLVGVPGLAKTLLVRSLADAMSLEFSRIQFTPDLMPSDITGTEILQETDQPGRRRFEYVKGPIFANVVLADEINRAPPKTQSALLEAMQEHRVTAGGHLYHLPSPFFVLATQNPVEQEGTYPLPEAQLDRFMFLIHVDYPSAAEEGRIARETTGGMHAAIDKTIDGEQLIHFQEVVRRVPVPDHIYDFVVDLVRRSRPGSENAPEWIRNLVTWGAGPRAVQYLILGAKARAALQGSYLVRIEDIEALAEPVLVHRILTSFHAESEGITSREIIKRLLEESSARV